MEKNKPNYYAVIPADVRYSKKVVAGAKLLYGEMTALSNEKGYCWATNGYFADLYGVTKTTISSWITSLQTNGFIHIEMKVTKIGTERRVFITEGGTKKFTPPLQKNLHPPLQKNLHHNITSTNTTSSNNTIPDLDTKSVIDKVVTYLNKKAGTKYRSTSNVTQTKIKARLNEKYTTEDFTKVIDTMTTLWLNDVKMRQYLRPETLFGNKFESYLNRYKPEYSDTEDIKMQY